MLRFIIIGDGFDKESLLRLSTENVTFLGILDHSKIQKILIETDLLFLPSKSEGFPKVVLEVAASGIPSIVYNTYGASEWMTNNVDGFIVDNFEEVKSLISRLLKDSSILEKISKNAFKLAAKYDWKVIIKDWETVIEDLFNES